MCTAESDNWELQGVLSYHGNCGQSRHPPIYTAINSNIREWIAHTMQAEATVPKREHFNV